MPDLIEVWSIEPGEVVDVVVFSDRGEALEYAASRAEMLWDASGEKLTKPGPPVTIRCYQMERAKYEALSDEEEVIDA